MNNALKFLRCILWKPTPFVVSINLTNKCNQHCIYCELGQDRMVTTKPLLNLDDMKWILDQMDKHDIRLISMGGGEPLLFKDIFEVVSYAHNKNIQCEIVTNGMLLKSLSEDQLNLLKECRTSISVSIDSFDAETENTIRGKRDALYTQLTGLEMAGLRGIRTTIATVISKYNYSGLFELVVGMNNYGAKFVKFQPVHDESNFPEIQGLEKKRNLNISGDMVKELATQFEMIEKYEEKHPEIKTNVKEIKTWIFDYYTFLESEQKEPFYSRLVKKYWCSSMDTIITINYYGELLPCNTQSTLLGIKSRDNHSDLIELWNNTCETSRRDIAIGAYPSCCRYCNYSLDFNVLGATLKYPIANRKNLSDVVSKVKRKLIRR